jgi:hypothetical protein
MRAFAVLLLVLAHGRLRAQTDYRNLDDHRPLRTQDAYPIERYAFEFVLPYELEQGRGAHHHIFAPELSHGIARNGQIELQLPFAAVSSAGATE